MNTKPLSTEKSLDSVYAFQRTTESKAVTDSGKAPSVSQSWIDAEMARKERQWQEENAPRAREALHYTRKEKLAASIVDQLCPIIADETKAHIGPSLFNKLTVRLTELL